MHEGRFTEQIVRSILDAVGTNPAGKPCRVTVQVGEMYHLEPESVRLHFDALTRDTPLEGVELDLQEIAVRVHCHDCGRTGGVEDHHMPLCISCGSTKVSVVEGNHVRVSAVDLEVPAG
jgi:hydrogenase nickel incorporation protein HypA/HybF